MKFNYNRSNYLTLILYAIHKLSFVNEFTNLMCHIVVTLGANGFIKLKHVVIKLEKSIILV